MSASLVAVVNLDGVAIWVGEVGMRQRSTMFASGEEAPTEIRDLCDNSFILFEAWQHVAEMALPVIVRAICDSE